MAKRQLKLYAKPQAGNTTTTTINNVNPQVTSATMESFTKMLNAFTNNTYEKTDLVETTNIDTETVKVMPTITIDSTETQAAFDETNNRYVARIEATPSVGIRATIFGTATKGSKTYGISFGWTASGTGLRITDIPNENATYSISLALPETETAYAVTTTATITVTAAS